MTTPPLRRCPTCEQSISHLDIGFRDWAKWLGDTLPGKIGPTDVDSILERHGRFLVIEYKSWGKPVSIGQEIMLRELAKLGMNVWYVQEPMGKTSDKLILTPMLEYRTVFRFAKKDAERITIEQFRQRISDWYAEADNREEEVK
jgi:hypothetical protein